MFACAVQSCHGQPFGSRRWTTIIQAVQAVASCGQRPRKAPRNPETKCKRQLRQLRPIR